MQNDTSESNINNGENKGSRNDKIIIVGSILLVLVVRQLAVSLIGVFWGIPFALLTIGIIFLLKHYRWSDLGLNKPESWKKTIIIGIGVALITQMIAGIAQTLLFFLGVGGANLSSFASIDGNIGVLVQYLIISWTTAGIGEEIIWRAFIIGQIALLFDKKREGWIIGLIVSLILFGLVHAYQGIGGIIMTGIIGLIFGIMYIKSNQNLWVTIIAHGTADTIAFLLLFFLV